MDRKDVYFLKIQNLVLVNKTEMMKIIMNENKQNISKIQSNNQVQ